jgi:hypothetical protein
MKGLAKQSGKTAAEIINLNKSGIRLPSKQLYIKGMTSKKNLDSIGDDDI